MSVYIVIILGLSLSVVVANEVSTGSELKNEGIQADVALNTASSDSNKLQQSYALSQQSDAGNNQSPLVLPIAYTNINHVYSLPSNREIRRAQRKQRRDERRTRRQDRRKRRRQGGSGDTNPPTSQVTDEQEEMPNAHVSETGDSQLEITWNI